MNIIYLIKIRMPRSKIYSEEEAKARRNERARIYQQNRYQSDKDFKEKRKQHSAKMYANNKIKLEEKLNRLEELEKMLKETTL